MSNNRAQIRHDIRKARNNLSKNQQEIAAHLLKVNFIQYLKSMNSAKKSHVALYLSNDGELDTSLLINELWSIEQHVYLPVIHPFNGANLLFQRYEKNSRRF